MSSRSCRVVGRATMPAPSCLWPGRIFPSRHCLCGICGRQSDMRGRLPDAVRAKRIVYRHLRHGLSSFWCLFAMVLLGWRNWGQAAICRVTPPRFQRSMKQVACDVYSRRCDVSWPCKQDGCAAYAACPKETLCGSGCCWSCADLLGCWVASAGSCWLCRRDRAILAMLPAEDWSEIGESICVVSLS